MKRFTETLKWSDPWFRRLEPRLKLLWLWLCDNCDHAGVLEVDWELATFQIGSGVSLGDVQKLDGRVALLECGKLHIAAFINFQFGALSADCKAHNPIFKALEKHRLSNGYSKGINTLQDKEQDKDKEKKGSPEGKTAEQILDGFRQSPAYVGIDVDREFSRMKEWLKTPKGKGRRLTHGFMVNWLNKVDPALPQEPLKTPAGKVILNYDAPRGNL